MEQSDHAVSSERSPRAGPVRWLEVQLARRNVQRGIAVACGLLAALLVLLLTTRGPGLTQDSATYESAALSLRNLRGAIASDGSAMVVFPPGYPALLAGVSTPGLGIRDAARVLGAASLGVIVTSMLIFLMPDIRYRAMAIVLAGAAIGVAGSLLLFATWQLSDVPFAALSFVVVLLLGHWHGRMTPAVTITVIGLAAIAPLLRYIGLALPLVVALVLLGEGRGRWWVRSFRSAGALALMMIPAAAWMARNYDISGTLTGGRGAGGFPPDAVLQGIGGSILHWVIPAREPLPPPLPAVVGTVFPLAIAVLLILTFRGQVNVRLRPLLLFVLVYLAALGVSEVLFSIDPVTDRFMLPVFVPTVLLVVLGLDRVADFLSRRFSRWLVPLVPALFLLVLAPIGVDGARWALGAYREGTGYFVPASRWTESQLIQDLQSWWPGIPVYTNQNAQVYLFAHRYASEMPAIAYTLSADAREWALERAREGALLVWLDVEPPQSPGAVVDAGMRLELIQSYADGVILRLVPVG